MNKLFELKFGSHLYGTNTPSSDLDIKSIYLPTAREIVLGSYKKTLSTTRPKQMGERNTKDDVDLEVFSLDRYLQLLSQGQAVALDMLFAPHYMYLDGSDTRIMEKIQDNRHEVLSSDISAFFGYARQQAAKYGIKGTRVAAVRMVLEWLNSLNTFDIIGTYPIIGQVLEWNNEHIKVIVIKSPNGKEEPHLEVCNRKIPFHAKVSYTKSVFQKIFDEYGHRALLAEKNEGVDWKALSHAVRVNSQAKELLTTGWITFPRPDRELLVDIKTGKMEYQVVAEIIENGLAELEVLKTKSSLRPEPNQEWINNFVYDIYSEIVVEENNQALEDVLYEAQRKQGW